MAGGGFLYATADFPATGRDCSGGPGPGGCSRVDEPGRSGSFKLRVTRRPIAAFERAAAIDPTNGAVQLYLGTAYLQQFIPGAESVENTRIAEAAQTHFQRALDLEPSNKVALASMASLSLNQKKWDDAERWYEKLIAADPNNADAYYSMGFLAWSRWYPAYSKARAGAGDAAGGPGPIQDAGVRADLTAALRSRSSTPDCAIWKRRWRSIPNTTMPWLT